MEMLQSTESGTESDTSDDTLMITSPEHKSQHYGGKSYLNSPKAKKRKYSPRKKKIKGYSACQGAEFCTCKGWKEAPLLSSLSVSTSRGVCSVCQHSYLDHFQNLHEQEKPSAVKDIQNLNLCIESEDDLDAKSVYATVSKLLSKSQQDGKKVDFSSVYGLPPFAKPSISQAIMNFVHMYTKNQSELPANKKLGKLVIEGINCTRLYKVKTFVEHFPNADVSAYKLTYARWLVYCHIPAFCKSLPYHKPSDIFGDSFLKSLFRFFKQSILDKFNHAKDNCYQKDRETALQSLLKFMSKLEKEVKRHDSEIWETDIEFGKNSPDAADNSAEVVEFENTSNECNENEQVTAVYTIQQSTSPPPTPDCSFLLEEPTPSFSGTPKAQGPPKKRRKITLKEMIKTTISSTMNEYIQFEKEVEKKSEEFRNKLLAQFAQSEKREEKKLQLEKEKFEFMKKILEKRNE